MGKWTGFEPGPKNKKIGTAHPHSTKKPFRVKSCIDGVRVRADNSPYAEYLQATFGLEIECICGDQ